MLLKSISLKNIRSYSSLSLNFEEGSTLLSGDIGAGKTTILLSLEFALFGLMKGMLSGGALLRHGSREGSVTLEFNIDQNNIKIYRALKRTSSGISQDAGFIEINSIRTECTAIELKSKILSILGYPDELITKSKSLIFRYTVYTPQEEMKQIIFDSEEDRLEKLTKIFNMEKYKRIRENAEVYAKELRGETKIYNDVNSELSSIKEQRRKYDSEMEEKNILLQQILSKLSIEEKKIKELESKIKSMEDSMKELSTLKHEISILELESKNLKKTSENMKTDISSLEAQYSKGSEELKKDTSKKEIRELNDINADLKKYKELKSETESKIIDYKSKISIITKKIEESSKLKESILTLTKCPTCQQEVNENHKEHIKSEEDKKINELTDKKSQAALFLDKAEKNMRIIAEKINLSEKDLLELKEEENKNKFKEKQEYFLKELEDKIVRTREKLKTYDDDMLSNEELLKKLKMKLEDSLIDENAMNEVNKEYKTSRNSYLSIKMQEASITQSIKEIGKFIELNEAEQERKKELLEKIQKKKELEHWLSNHFINLVSVIEKNVMGSIRGEFKEHFEDWFNMLIEDESISATLDDKFTPKISQNGYDTEIENLSGGEKTAVALAYRLALNKVINSMMGNIKTKDLLILDEPTDGFSSHQLDKVREVLEALNSKQTIIVSHESKMESFVDHIIKIHKHEHESEVL